MGGANAIMQQPDKTAWMHPKGLRPDHAMPPAGCDTREAQKAGRPSDNKASKPKLPTDETCANADAAFALSCCTPQMALQATEGLQRTGR